MALLPPPAPASVRLRARSAQVTASLCQVTPPQRLRASALVVLLTAALLLLVTPGLPVGVAVTAAAAAAGACVMLAGSGSAAITVRLSPHLLRLDGVGELPLAAIRHVRREADGRVWVRTAAQALALPRPVVEEDAQWLCAWLSAAADDARARLRAGEDPDDCAPPAALEALRRQARA